MAEISGMIQQFLEGNIKTLSAEPVIESKTITENGTYTAPEGVDGYSPVVVNVPPTEPVIESKTITENGTYTPESGVDGFAPVIVNVPPTEPVIESKNISENGTYTAPAGVDGYSPVIVNVPQPTLSTLEVSDNGDYDAPSGTAYNRVEVNVPLPENAYLLKSVSNLPQAIASFSDGAVAPMMSLKVAIEPQQEGSGDPSPTNVRPISGWTEEVVSVRGKNYFNPSDKRVGKTVYGNDSVGSTATLYDSSATDTYEKIAYLKAGTTYTLSYSIDGSMASTNDRRGYIVDDNNVVLQASFITQTPNANSITITPTVSGWLMSAFDKNTINLQLELGSTATTYEAYNGTTTTIPFVDGQGQSVEVFGGSVDVVNGTSKNEKTLGEITLNGSENYTINSEGTDKISFRRWEGTAQANADGFQISNRLIYNRNAWRESAPGFSFVVGTNELFLTIPKTTASTVEELKTWIASNNIQIVYELATPTTIQLTPTEIRTLLGMNNIWADTGDIEVVEYFSKEV